ncbi:MAG: hypothetical protein Q8L24_02010 [bacterium]|nr:hypothetical protein [bacterium]
MEINWYGNDGSCNPLPGTMTTAICGVCGSQMNVKRNVLGTTSLAEAMSGNKHLYDKFTCPNKNKNWHLKICRLKMKVYKAEMNEADNLEELRKKTKKEILEILKANGIK